MAVVNSDILLLTQAGIKTEFDAAYADAQVNPDWQAIANELGTTLPTQNYAWLGQNATMKEWTGESEDQSVLEQSYNLSDKLYDAVLAIERSTLEDEQYGLLMMRARNLANQAVRHWNKLVYTGLALGFTTLCHDGQYMFDTDHVTGDSGTQSNKGTSALSDGSLEAAYTAMLGYKDDKGEPLEIVPDTLVVGPKNARNAWNLCGQPTVVAPVGSGTAGSGATASTGYANFFNGRFKTVVSPYLIDTYDDYWFLLDTSREVKPIFIQSRSDVPIVTETDMANPQALMNEKFKFRVRGRYRQGYGLALTGFGALV